MANGDYNTSNSRLWVKFQRNFATEIKERYFQLRTSGKLSMESFEDAFFTKVISKIGQRYFNLDAFAKYIPYKEQYIHMCNGSREEFTRRWLKERLIYMDSIYGYGKTVNTYCTIRSNVKGDVTLKLKTYSPQMVTISFSGAQGSTQTLKCNKDDWTVFKGFISTERDNEINISNAGQIMYIDGIKELYPSVLLLGEANKLIEINCSNSPYMRTLELSTNYLLQKVDCSGCKYLGDISSGGNPKLNLSASTNLKYLNCSNTKLSIVKFNEKGGALKSLDCSNTNITEFSITGQEFLTDINLSNCTDLCNLSISNCNNLLSLALPDTKLQNFNIDGCKNLSYLDISNNSYLKTLNLSSCPNLKKLDMQSIPNLEVNELDLTTCTSIKELNISKCSNLNYIRFSKNFNSLTSFTCNDSGIIAIQFGLGTYPDYLDLTRFSFTDITFFNCVNIKKIKGINLITKDSSPFYNCRNLESITGYVKLSGNASFAFNNCSKLTELPELDLSEVTKAFRIFANTGINNTQFENILKKLVSCKEMEESFNNIPNVYYDKNTPLPATLLENCVELTKLKYAFTGNSWTVTLPSGIFSKNTKLMYIDKIFDDNVLTGTIPENLFANCTELVTVNNFFESSSVTNIPESLFANCSKLTEVNYLFNNCTSITGTIPENLFKNCTELTEAVYFFSRCSNITGIIPENLFANCPKLTNVSYFLNKCSNITGTIPENLFVNCTQLLNVSYFFSGCSKLTGEIPSSLFNNCSRIVDMSSLFKGCSSLGGLTNMTQELPVNLFKNKRYLLDISNMFDSCSLLKIVLEKDIFKDCSSLSRINFLFANCRGLISSIPSGLFNIYDENNTPITDSYTEAGGVFSNCVNLTGTIPEDLFSNFSNVTTLYEFFNGCMNLTGTIPAKLFNKCTNVTNISSMFSNNTNLGITTEEADNLKYCVDENLFANCINLEDVSNIFNGYPYGSGNKGVLPPGLFKNCPKLKNTSYAFNMNYLTGTLSALLFSSNPLLENIAGTFINNSYITKIEDNFITKEHNPNLHYMEHAFAGCSSMTGTAPELWNLYPDADQYNCFENCNKLTNYASIPESWK